MIKTDFSLSKNEILLLKNENYDNIIIGDSMIKKKQKLHAEFYSIINPILLSEEFQKRKTYLHHGKISVYDHSLKVSFLSYKIAKILHLDYKSAAIAGLLHDFFESPWQEDKEKHKFFEQHGFTHAQNALENTRRYFPEYLNPKIENAILRHMFPLNIKPPKHKIGWIVTSADKIVAMEVLRYPSMLLLLLGIKIR